MPDPLDPGALGGSDPLDLAWLLSTATVQRATRTTDAGGGQAEAWNNTYLNVRCRVDQVQRMQAEVQGTELHRLADWLVSFFLGTDVQRADKIIVDGAQTYQVMDDNNGMDGALALHCQCVRLTSK